MLIQTPSLIIKLAKAGKAVAKYESTPIIAVADYVNVCREEFGLSQTEANTLITLIFELLGVTDHANNKP